MCCAVSDADTQLTVFDSSAPEKQLLIFLKISHFQNGEKEF